MPSYTTRKTKKGTFVDVRFLIVDEDGKRIYKRLCGYPNKREAQKAYLDFMKTYTPPSFTLKKNNSYLYNDLLAIYFKKKETELAVSSYYDVNWIFNKFITPYFSGKEINKLKKNDYLEWQTNLWAEKNPRTGDFYAQKYLSKIRTLLNTFLDWVEEMYEIPNLLKSIKKPKRRETKTEMKVWTLDEFKQFMKVVDDCLWKTFFMFLFFTGCRVGEVIALTDNDIINNTVVINKSRMRKTMKTNEKYIISPPKTATSNRTLALPDILIKQLKEYFEYKKENQIPSKFLFGGDNPIAQRTYQRRFNDYTDAAGLQKIRIHDLRHSHATMLINAGVPITTISKRMGHSSVKMTLDVYSHCYESSDNEAVGKINDIVNYFN